MLNLREMYRPKTIEEALALLARPDTVALAGGTELVASGPKEVRAVVDLSDLWLAYIRDENGAVAIGAMTLLADVAESPMLRAAANGVIAEAAHRSAASLLRNQATAAGTLIAEPAGVFAAALVAMDANVTIVSSPPKGESSLWISGMLARRKELLRDSIVTELLIPKGALTRRAAIETVARTPRDKPIVAVCAAVGVEDGVVRSAAIALGEVGGTVVRAGEAERELLGQPLGGEVIAASARMAMEMVEPTSDVRGSAEYRKEMVRVLTARVLGAIS